MGTELADQTLADHAPQGAGHQPGLHADVLQTVDGGDGVVGVQGREDQVAGDGCPHGDGGRLTVAYLAHGDDVRVLTQDRAQAAGKGHAGLFVDLTLVHASLDRSRSILDMVGDLPEPVGPTSSTTPLVFFSRAL